MPPLPRSSDERYRRTGLWPGETLWTAWARTADRAGDHPALVEGPRRTSYRALAGQAERLAAGLAALGVRPGDGIAFQLPNWTETVAVMLAAARLGAVANPVLPTHRDRELRFVLTEGGARVLFVPGRYRGTDHRSLVAAIRADGVGPEHVVVVRDAAAPGTLTWEDVAETGAGLPPPFTDGSAVALLIYTSGSTADAKGVLHSHDTLLAEGRSLGPVHGFGPRDVTLMPSPLTHVSGIAHGLLVPAVFGTTVVLMDRWEAAEGLALIAAERVTYMVGAPTFLRDLVLHPARASTDLSSLRLFSCGGADVDPTLVREAAAALGCVVKRVYGSTEFPTVTTTGPDDPPERRADGEGRAIGANELRLVDDDGRPVPAGTEGEVLARGPELFLGYQNVALDAEAFDADGWFRTGDLGVIDAEGYLRITGRKKDIIIRKGENISAREVEDVIAAHPAVAEVAVVGLPDAAAGEIACAVIRCRAGASPPTLATLVEFLLARGLSKRKLPERLEVVEDFPRAASGKIVKRALKTDLARRAP
jgi:cyclohexanecarboxylate-CoA ligase